MNHTRAWTFPFMFPAAAHQFTESEHQEHTGATRGIQHSSAMRLLQACQCLIYEKFGDVLRRVMHAVRASSIGVPLMTEGLVNLTKHAHGNVSEVQIIPIHCAGKCELDMSGRDGVVAF